MCGHYGLGCLTQCEQVRQELVLTVSVTALSDTWTACGLGCIAPQISIIEALTKLIGL